VLHQIRHRLIASPVTTNHWHAETIAGQLTFVSKQPFYVMAFSTEIEYAFFISPMRPECSVHLNPDELIPLIGPVFREEYKLWRSLCKFLYHCYLLPKEQGADHSGRAG
jgi:hypothetical protein